MFKIFPATVTHDHRKVPVRGFKWKEQATDNQNVINTWSKMYPQLKYYGVPTGPINNILVLDIDVKTGGFETIKNYHVPLTMSQNTLSGGKHYIYKYPDDGNVYGNKVEIDKGLDIRGLNGYIFYYGADNTPICEAPEWLKQAALTNKPSEVNLENIAQVVPDIAQKILNESCDNIRNAPEGERNNTLNIESYKVGQLLTSNSINREEAYNSLFLAAKEIGIEEYEAQATLQSAFKGGESRPITCPFGNVEPILKIPKIKSVINKRWTPSFFSNYDLTNFSKLRKPQIFENWSSEDIQVITADGGTGKTTLKLFEAVCLALGEDFLGFKCKGEGRTLYITGEDTKEKLGAMIGMILKQMGHYGNKEIVEKVRNNIVVKLDDELCLITKTKAGFIKINPEALDKVMEAVDDLKPKMIVFDPISSFWGSEASLNDMSRAVTKFMSALVKKSNASVEMLNHMGKQSSNNKDMSQFAGRGGTGLPSHSRVSKVLRPVFDDEFRDITGMELDEDKSAMMCNVNKFSDGSPLYNKPFIILRSGYLFSKVELLEQKAKDQENRMSDVERIFTFIKTERNEGRYPNKEVINGKFAASTEPIPKARITSALACLEYDGHMGEKIKKIDSPDIESNVKVYLVIDKKGEEI